MAILEWIQFIAGTAFLFLGILTFVLQILGVYRFKYVLNRMHTAAIGDTLGIGISLIGVMIFSGFHFNTLKIGLVVVFLWCASPVSSHLIARLEAETNPKVDQYCEMDEEVKKLINERESEEEA